MREGSWVVVNGVISRVAILVTHIRGLTMNLQVNPKP